MKRLKIANRLIVELEYIGHQTVSAMMKPSSYAISWFVIIKHISIDSIEVGKFYDGQLAAKLPRMVREKIELDCLQAPPEKYGPSIQMGIWISPKCMRNKEKKY